MSTGFLARESPRLPSRQWTVDGMTIAMAGLIHALGVMLLVAAAQGPVIPPVGVLTPPAAMRVVLPPLVFHPSEPARDGGGGGGGGNRQRGPIRHAEAVGRDAITVRTRQQPPTAVGSTADSTPPLLLLDARPLASGNVDQPGLPVQWEAYRSASQTVSELSAIGAPTRPQWVVLGFAYSLLITAFGWGVWASARRNRPLRAVGGVMVTYGVVSLAWPFAPMHLRGAEFTLTDTLHIVLAMVTVLLMLLAMGFGAAALGKRFRLYSIATMVILVVFGALTGVESPRLAANLPTPWIGVWERASAD